MKDLSNDVVKHIKIGGIEYLQFRKLCKYTEINHLYTLGLDLNFRTSSQDEAKKAKESYIKILNITNSKFENLVKPTQAHTDVIKKVDVKINKNEPDFNLSFYNKTDGLVTNKKKIILSTTNADCIILMFYDPIKKVIANLHSGWKGTVQRISVKAVNTMIKEFRSNPKDILCAICPSIRKCHFEVEKDVMKIFKKEFTNEYIFEKVKDKKWLIDTVEINKKILKEVGLKEENILDSGICSVCNSDLIHSYRVEKTGYSLNTGIIEIKEEIC